MTGDEQPYIDRYDIEILKRWLSLAKTGGTQAIRIVAGDEPNTYKVTVGPPIEKRMPKKGGEP